MKKGKILASLCAGALLCSASVSFAGDRDKKEISPSHKVEKIINYFKNLDKVDAELEAIRKYSALDLPPDIVCGVPGVCYGVHYATFYFHGDRLEIAVHKAGGESLYSHTEFYLYDWIDNGYGSLDVVLDDSETKDHFKKVELNPEEKEVFDKLYKGIIDRFYSENEARMAELEKLENAMDILRNKEIRGKKK